jgi:hypothetical protein
MHSTPLCVPCIEHDPADEVLVRLAVRRLPMSVQCFTIDEEVGVISSLEQDAL